MDIRPTLKEAEAYVSDYRVIPVSCEINCDQKTPLDVLKILKERSSHCFLLESLAHPAEWGRYTFLGTVANNS